MKLRIRQSKAASSTEYAILITLIGSLSIGAVYSFAKGNSETFTSITSTLSAAAVSEGNVGNADTALGGDMSGSMDGDASGQKPDEPTAPVEDCYDPAKVGFIGQSNWLGDCEGMLIVSTSMLQSAASSSIPLLGDESFQIEASNGEIYTFEDSELNVFTGQVDDLSYLFARTDFNGDIGYWDTSNVKKAYSTFLFATSFNQDISMWDMSNVTNMIMMFSFADKFNQPIGVWNTSNVVTMNDIFFNASTFNQPLAEWDTSNVISMNSLFYGASSFNQDISQWDTSKVDEMNGMFWNAFRFNQDLSGWCVKNLSEPGLFDLAAYAWSQGRPVWGTCPNT